MSKELGEMNNSEKEYLNDSDAIERMLEEEIDYDEKEDMLDLSDDSEVKDQISLRKNISEKYKKLDKSQRVQLIFAAVITLVILILFPAFAWFAFQKEMAVSTKVNSPATIEIRAGAQEEVINFDLSGIDAEKAVRTYEDPSTGQTYYFRDYVFCVKGKAINSYNLQLAHTTNIAFKYDIYRLTEIPGQATEDSEDELTNDYALYVSLDRSVKRKYRRENALNGSYVNNAGSPGGRIIAQDNGSTERPRDLTARSYDVGTDSYQKYANPAYWIAKGIPIGSEEHGDDGFVHFYSLRVSWIKPDSISESDDEDLDQLAVFNNKETDMIYITAGAAN